MPLLETIYDYTIHRECFRVFDSASYTHTTNTLFELTNTVSEVINYFTATFSLDVIRNLGDGTVGIYDNGKLLQLVPFDENTNKITDLEIDLNYNVEHMLEARYLGNDECLASKSITIPLTLEIPSDFNSQLTFFNLPTGNVISNPIPTETLTLKLTDDNDDAISSATVKVYVDDEEPVSLTTDSNGQCQLVGGTHWTPSFGIHQIKARYETTAEHFGVEAEIELYVGYIATLTPTQQKYIVGQTPTFNIEAKNYNDTPIANMNVTLYRGD